MTLTVLERVYLMMNSDYVPNIDLIMVYAMSVTNLSFSINIIFRGSSYLSASLDLRGRDRSCFVIPVAYGMAYFGMQLDWLAHAASHISYGALRDMAWLLMEFATLVYMSGVIETNIRKRMARFRIEDEIYELRYGKQGGGGCAN